MEARLMAAGDLVVDDLQVELRATLMGKGTHYRLDVRRGSVGGLFDIATKSSETAWAHADGSFVGEVFQAARTVTVALIVTGATQDAVAGRVATLRTAWAPSHDDLPLWFKWPHFGKGYVVGRPIGLTVDYSRPLVRAVPVLGSFRVTDPTIHTP
jgi:hypothetical protein